MLNGINPRLATLTLFSAALLALPSCTKKATEESADKTGVVTVGNADGGAVVETTKVVATVKSIDKEGRHVTLTLADGSETIVKCGPEVVNFPQIQVKDKVTAVLTEELAIFLSRGTSPIAGQATGISVRARRAKPAARIADVVQINAKISAIDTKTRVVTFAHDDGSTLRLKVGSQVDLTNVKPGDEVTARYARSVAISVDKP